MSQPALQIPLPSAGAAAWSGHAFLVDGVEHRFLRFPVGESGWNDDLTFLHEAEAGEGTHYIDVASRRHAIAEITRVTRGRFDPAILEIGISSGYLLEDIKAAFPKTRLLGADFTNGKFEELISRLPDTCFLQFDITKCPLPDDFLDVVVALNVLEHIEDDEAAARQIARILAPGGTAVIEVPAGPELYDAYDRQLMHFRRYRLDDLARLMTAAGLHVERRSYLGFILYPAFWAVKKLSRAREPSLADKSVDKAAFGSAIGLSATIGVTGHALMRLESCLRHAVPIPFGIRCLVTARKPIS